ncbi:hypothetical protein LSCM1_02416 [Leishmania martiniquensis]|uniref:J domain-containing protein n=1 Tax=Leishmania martiniquensis TaxID=1580590 RepID=A0A836G5J9_9TRYP|nr:hypothetical protein LSCM1_02416 [Leishmania martiniquensis]
MHRSTRDASRPVPVRSSALAGMPAAVSLAPTRCVSQTYRRFTSAEVKLPVLQTPATIQCGSDAKRSPHMLASSAALEDARCMTRKSRVAHLTATEERPCPLSSLQPIKSPGQRLASSKSSTSDDSTLGALQRAAGQDEAGSRLSYTSAVESLHARQEYVDVYFLVSSLLSVGDDATKVEVEGEKRRFYLLSYRCLCSYALLRFKECCEDGIAVVSLHRHLQGGSGSSPLSTSEEALHSRVLHALLGALVMRELYKDARELLERLPGLRDGEGVLLPEDPSGTPFLLSAAQHSVIPSLASFRQCVSARRWGDAARILDSSAVARSWIQATPLCAMLAFVRLEQDDPKAARGLLLPYLASLPEPPLWEALSAGPVEHAQLWGNFISHYVFSMTLLAKASFMCGSAYLNISAAVLQRVLKLSPLYAPARLFAEFVLSYEAQQKRVDGAMLASDYPLVLSVTAAMLRMPEVTRLVHAELHLARAQAQWMQRQLLEVVKEASCCVQCDPECALAFRLRADAFQMMSKDAEAAADRAAATHLHARVDAIFDELRAQRSRYEAAQMKANAKRHSIPVFASLRCASARLRSSPREDFGGGRGKSSRSDPTGPRRTDGDLLAESLRTHYDVLGVSSDASVTEIRKRYRRLTLQCHPDRLVGATESERRAALEAFQVLGNAYSVLSDVQLRAAYDDALRRFF